MGLCMLGLAVLQFCGKGCFFSHGHACEAEDRQLNLQAFCSAWDCSAVLHFGACWCMLWLCHHTTVCWHLDVLWNHTTVDYNRLVCALVLPDLATVRHGVLCTNGSSWSMGLLMQEECRLRAHGVLFLGGGCVQSGHQDMTV
jgi:hypothetical protein